MSDSAMMETVPAAPAGKVAVGKGMPVEGAHATGPTWRSLGAPPFTVMAAGLGTVLGAGVATVQLRDLVKALVGLIGG